MRSCEGRGGWDGQILGENMKNITPAVSPLMKMLSTHIAGAIKKPLPRDVTELAKLHIVDTYAAMLSGASLLPGQRAIAHVKALGGKPQSAVVGTGIVTNSLNAALANGMLAHADETDGGHIPTLSHPYASVLPASLAIAEREGLSGAALLRATVLGFEVGTRVVLALGPRRFLFAGHHAAACVQLFGSAAASCALLALDARRTRYALSYTAQQTAGLFTMFRDPEHIEKAFAMGGMPARNGLAAAIMASEGFTGVEDVFSGDRDFFYTFAPGDTADREALVRGLGREWEIRRGNIKRWPIAGPIQGPANVLWALIQKHGIRANDVAAVVVRVPDWEVEIIDDRPAPEMCLQHVLALILVDGRLGFAAAHDFQRLRERAVLVARKRVELLGDSRLAKLPRAWGCAVEVRLKDGRSLSSEVQVGKGSSGNPLSRAELEEKMLDLGAPSLGRRRTRQLLDGLWQIEKIKNVRDFRALTRP